MSEPFLGEISIMGFDFAPRGWSQCDGQILPINQNQSLYSLLGTNYGGDGRTTFGLPDLRGRVPVFWGTGAGGSGFNPTIGQKGGVENVTLQTSQIPQHQHNLRGSTAQATSNSPDTTKVYAQSSSNIYHGATNLVNMRATAIGNTGGNQAHNDMQPYLALNFCIALVGLFPSRN